MTDPSTSASASSFLPPRMVDVELDPKLKPTAWQFACAIRDGTAFEIACWGSRGEGKSWAALWGMVLHALEHQRRGFPLPVIWLGLRDTFANHILSTHKSTQEPAWEGRWHLSAGGHVVTYEIAEVPFVRLELVGVDSPADAEKVRTQCHCVWAEEVASVMELSAGIPIDLWYQAGSSARLGTTHANVACLTSNMPDEADDYWQRFHVQRAEGTLEFRIPPRERASDEYRERLGRMYASRPDLARRLLEGKPGTLILGVCVAEGFDEDLHSPQGVRVPPILGEPVWIGQDGGLTPTSVILQRQGACLRCIGALSTDHGGMLQHVEYLLRPWLSEHVPWVLQSREAIRVCYDPAMETEDQGDSRHSALRLMRQALPAIYRPGPVKWLPRRELLLNALGPGPGRPGSLLVDPVQARGLVVALRGGWHYATGPDGKARRDEPVKNHPHSDYGDALCYALAEAAPGRSLLPPSKPPTVVQQFSVFDHGREQLIRLPRVIQ